MNFRRTQASDEEAKYRPDEKAEGKAPADARMRGSWKKLRGMRKSKKRHRRR